MATYTANIPVVGQSLGNSRPTINSNFSAIQTTFDANHVDFNSPNPGFHTHVDLLEQGSDPNPPIDACSHYSKAVAGVTEWFFQRENSGAVIQMSKGTPTVSANGYTFLPGGVLFQWGTATASIGSASVTFPLTFPGALFSITIGVVGGSNSASGVVIFASSTAGFTASTQVSNRQFYWMALGN